VSALTVSTATAGTAGAVGAVTDSTTAATFSVSALFDAGLGDTVTVSFVQNGAFPATAAVAPRLAFLETSTAAETQIDNTLVQASSFITTQAATESITSTGVYSISRTNAGYAGAKFGLYLESATSTVRPAGAYNFTIIVKQYSAGVTTPVTTTYPATITIAAAAAAAKAVSTAATAYLQAGTSPIFTSVLGDSATSGSLVAGTVIGQIKVDNNSAVGVSAVDTITVSMTGPGTITDGTTTGRSFSVVGVSTRTFSLTADGTSGDAKITITTGVGASFVKTVTFFDTKPTTAVATVKKAFIKAGTGSVADVFSVVVKDVLGNAINAGGVTVTAAPTDTATTVGGAATCAWDSTAVAYMCAVAGLSATKFGPVAYTITATGTGINLATKVTTTATVTFSDNVATKAVLAGPASAAPGASVEYTLTLTDKNGYAVADQTYGVGSAGGVLFTKSVTSGWGTAPFATTESFTSVSGVITSKGIMPLAGTATGTWTLVGDGLQTLAANAIDKTIGATTITVSTDVANAAADAATAAAEEATAAAQDATDAALGAAEAAEAAGALAQEAVDLVTELSTKVTELISALKAQITTLTNLVIKIQKKVKA
jgi:hypothetical protein